MVYKINSYNAGTDKLDTELLKKLLKDTPHVTDRNKKQCIYYIAQTEKYTDICREIFKRHGINMEIYNTSLCPYPVLKITLENAAKLPPESQAFLNNIVVYENELNGRLQQIQMAMQGNQK